MTGHAGRLGGVDVRLRIADHHGARRIAARGLDRHGEMARIGLVPGERVSPADGREAISDPERLQQPPRMQLDLVRADRQPVAALRERVERVHDMGEEVRFVAEPVGVDGEE